MLFERWAIYSIGPMLGLYLRYISDHIHQLSAISVGFVSSGFFLFEPIAGPLMGALSDRLGRKIFLLTECVIGAITAVIYPLTTAIFAIFLLQSIEGIAAGTPALSLSYLSDISDYKVSLRGNSIAIFEIINFVGLGLGVASGGFLWDAFKTNAFLFVAIMYFLGFLIFLLGLHESKSLGDRSKKHFNDFSIFPILRNRNILTLTIPWLLLNIMITAWATQSAFQLTGGIKDPNQRLVGLLSGSDIGILFLITVPVILTALFFWGRVLVRFSKRSIILISLASLLIVWVLLYLINHYTPSHLEIHSSLTLIVGVIFSILIFFATGFIPAFMTLIANITDSFSGQKRGAIMGFYWMFVGLGRLIGSWIGGVFAAVAKVDGLIFMSILITVIILLNILFKSFE